MLQLRLLESSEVGKRRICHVNGEGRYDMSPNIPYTLILSNAAIDFCREMQFQRLAQNCPSHPRARSAMSPKERSKNIPHHRLF